MRPYIPGTIFVILALTGYGLGFRASAVAVGVIGAAFLIAPAMNSQDE